VGYTFYTRHPKGHAIGFHKGLTKKEAERRRAVMNRRKRKIDLKCTFHVVLDKTFKKDVDEGAVGIP
jgi:hypothetical protein